MFAATVVRALVASPSDVEAERVAAREEVWRWSGVHVQATRVALLPLMWEHDSTPAVGDRPQGILNKQIVDRADLVIAIFWTRLGSPTGVAESGTVEEIERCIEDGKPVLVYFSSQPVVPDSLDTTEYARLQAFKKDLRQKSLYHDFDRVDDLRRKLYDDLTRTVRECFGGEVGDIPANRARALPVARIDRERVPSGVSPSGKPRYKTNLRLIIENAGSAPADDLEWDLIPDSDGLPPEVLSSRATVTRLAPGGNLSYTIYLHEGVADQCDIRMTWREEDEEHEDTHTLRLR